MSESTQTVDVDAPAAPEAQKPEKQPKFRIVVDDAGNEVSRSPLGRGRPPAGSHRDDNDNLVVPQSALNKTVNKATRSVEPQRVVVVRSPVMRSRPKARMMAIGLWSSRTRFLRQRKLLMRLLLCLMRLAMKSPQRLKPQMSAKTFV